MDGHKELKDNLAYQFSQANKWMNKWYNHYLEPINLTIATVLSLKLLAELEAATPTQLAKRLEVSKPTMTAQLDRMLRDGLIHRNDHSSNRKMIVIALTTEGKQKLEKSQSLLQKAEKKLDSLLKQNLYSLKSEITKLNEQLAKNLSA